MWRHIHLLWLHLSAVQVVIKSSPVPRGIHTVTKSHFARDILTDTGAFAFQSAAFISSFSTLLYKGALPLSVCRSQAGNSYMQQSSAHTHTLMFLYGQPACYRTQNKAREHYRRQQTGFQRGHMFCLFYCMTAMKRLEFGDEEDMWEILSRRVFFFWFCPSITHTHIQHKYNRWSNSNQTGEAAQPALNGQQLWQLLIIPHWL